MSDINLKGKSFLTLLDFTPEEIEYMIETAAKYKKMKKEGESHKIHEGKNVALIFEKTSTRTRCAFEVAAADLGMHAVYLDSKGSQIGKKESISDTAKVLGRMFDGIEYRGFGQERVEELAKYSGVPVWNGLTDEFHPTQILATLLTIKEHFGKLEGLTMCFCGDGRNNMARSLMLICSKFGINFSVFCPKELSPDQKIIEICTPFAKQSGSQIRISDEISVVKNADCLYTDVWVSMGEEALKQERIKLLQPYQVNKALMEATGNPNTILLHCLPAVKEQEVTEEVFESDASKVWDEAENRKHTIKAIMLALI